MLYTQRKRLRDMPLRQHACSVLRRNSAQLMEKLKAFLVLLRFTVPLFPIGSSFFPSSSWIQRASEKRVDKIKNYPRARRECRLSNMKIRRAIVTKLTEKKTENEILLVYYSQLVHLNLVHGFVHECAGSVAFIVAVDVVENLHYSGALESGRKRACKCWLYRCDCGRCECLSTFSRTTSSFQYSHMAINRQK